MARQLPQIKRIMHFWTAEAFHVAHISAHAIIKPMRIPLVRPLSRIVVACCACATLHSQTTKPQAPSKIEPGLDLAVKWKWWVLPSDSKQWGLPLPDAPAPDLTGLAGQPAVRPETYEVKKGDAIIIIARKFGMTADQLKQFNALKDNLIRVGQVLRIPTEEQVRAMAPPPPEPKKEAVDKKKSNKHAEPVNIDAEFGVRSEVENVTLQVFLDREMFSPGPIDGKSGETYQKMLQLYQNTHEDVRSPDAIKTKAEAAVPEPYIRYTLRREDFRFILPPKPDPAAPGGADPGPAKKKITKKPASLPPPPLPPPPTLDELTAATFLGYANPWEFVAERYHCDEAFLHRLNPDIKTPPATGTTFQVPNVIPFEIEKALDAPLQPTSDPLEPITAAVVELSRLEISRTGKLIAVMPLASARPGLRGRGAWTVLDAIPQPRMASKRELREIPKENPAPAGDAIPSAAPVMDPPLEKEQYLAPGPNNPVGILWINLAKSRSTDPLPYGLHGTGIPAQMRKLQGIGGLRLTNWDIARAVRLMPAGTALQWKQR